MGSLKTWIDWAVLAMCMAAALVVVFICVNALESTVWMQSSREHAAIGVLTIIFGMAVVNAAFLVGAGVCKLRRDRRIGER